ncbi:hypothetical protein B4080_1606 [Bacillus cereus]|nr:hypothetical protein B4080_1606 [Bacillus cereus]
MIIDFIIKCRKLTIFYFNYIRNYYVMVKLSRKIKENTLQCLQIHITSSTASIQCV